MEAIFLSVYLFFLCYFIGRIRLILGTYIRLQFRYQRLLKFLNITVNLIN